MCVLKQTKHPSVLALTYYTINRITKISHLHLCAVKVHATQPVCAHARSCSSQILPRALVSTHYVVHYKGDRSSQAKYEFLVV